MTNREKIEKLLRENPEITNKEIAEIIGCSPSYISIKRRKFNDSQPTMKVMVELDVLNTYWLRMEAIEHNIPVETLIRGIITDARQEEGK